MNLQVTWRADIEPEGHGKTLEKIYGPGPFTVTGTGTYGPEGRKFSIVQLGDRHVPFPTRWFRNNPSNEIDGGERSK